MNQRELWKDKWNNIKLTKPNGYAIRVFSKIDGNKRSILDIGCGDGRDSLYFSRKNLLVTSLDF